MTMSAPASVGASERWPMPLPEARGEVSRLVIERLRGGPVAAELDPAAAASAVSSSRGLLEDDDVQLALFLLYELHYGGLAGVDDRLEWEPAILAFRRELETAYEAELRQLIPQPHATRDVPEALFALVEASDDGPGLSNWVETDATAEQVREVMVHRSIYTLKEADPHSWAIPRLHGRAKAALVEIQADEYGGGRPERLHAEIFAKTLRALGLDDRYGAYADHVPALVYASMNLMSLLGLHRRLRGAIAGHLAAYEMTSSIPCRAYANGFRRLGLGDEAADYFDEHVEADAVHEQVAARDLAGGLAADEPELADDILFGAAACLTVDGRLWSSIRSAFEAGGTALRKPLS
ncbi:iron-containing redox enzyme family protein [Agromyces sp. G08B096]|uniref:Iron-containing redox enzyme family protein n=1 Tax=Agromyces sp. G08B096 TaxID=3156399 RepID=A0AAU7W6M1_9MICO